MFSKNFVCGFIYYAWKIQPHPIIHYLCILALKEKGFTHCFHPPKKIVFFLCRWFFVYPLNVVATNAG